MGDSLADVKSIFGKALELHSPAEREAYLLQACGGDPQLRADVESLLQAQPAAGVFFDGLKPSPAATLDAPLPSERPGTVIGPYKLLQQIGEGGMGTVWMAQQTEPVKRVIALKLIKAGMDSTQVIARFEAERQALALMEHPNIARVLDAGTTGAGRPYFVMDLVKGVPITKYCDEHHLTPRQRLELFVPVCQAIQHAHQKGIIHRDLKPSNVLVALYDGKPVPKVIDFGVAKAAGQPLTEKTLVTGFGNIVGTLEYMSPEQAEVNQLDIDTRSDIYSLGVLLYELLAGSPPFSRKDLEKAGMLEMLRVIREQEPSKPSTKLSTAEGLPTLAANRGTEPTKLTKLVRGELDWIVMKALEKDRNRRYESANGFAADVQRYLADEPVLACPPSAGYRLRKFARRNKGGLAVAALVLLFLVVLGSGIGWAVRDRAAREEAFARERAIRQDALEQEVKLALKEAEQLQGQEKWPEALSAAKRAEGLLAGSGGDELRERVRQLRKDLEMVLRLEEIPLLSSEVKENLFDWKNADEAYTQAFADYGIDVLRLPVDEAAARIRTRDGVAVPLAAALDDWAWTSFRAGKEQATRLSLTAVAQAADSDPWRRQARQAVQLPKEDRKALAALAASPELLRQPPTSLMVLARALRVAGLVEAEIEMLRQAQRKYPGDFWINYDLGLALIKLGPSFRDEAISFYRATLAVRPRSTAAHIALGNALRQHGRVDEAIACYLKAIEIDAKYALAHNNLGLALAEQKKPDEAIACFKKAIDLNPKSAAAHGNLALALNNQRKLDEAVPYYKKASDLDPKDPVRHFYLGLALDEQGKLDAAIAAYRQAIELDRTYVAAHYNLGRALFTQCGLSDGYTRKRIDAVPYLAAKLPKLAEAAARFKKAIELDPKLFDSYVLLGEVLRYQGQLDEAIATLQKAIDLKPKAFQPWYLRALVYRDLQQPDKARADFAKAIELQPDHEWAWERRHQTYGGQLDRAVADYTKDIERKPDNVIAWFYRGQAHAELKQYDQALADYTKATELKPDDVRVWRARGYFHSRLKQNEEAVADFSRAIQLRPRDTTLLSARAAQYRILKQWDKALADYSKAIEISPDYKTLWYQRTDVYLQMNQPEKAVAEYSNAIERKPNDTGLLMGRADLYTKLKQWDKAVADWTVVVKREPGYGSNFAWWLATCPDPKFRDAARAVELAKKAVESRPDNGSFWRTLGVAHYRAGDWKAAVAALDKSMELLKVGDSSYWFFLAMAHWQLNDNPEARKWYDKAVEWMDKNPHLNEELRRFRAEASELLGVADRGRVEVAPAPHEKKK